MPRGFLGKLRVDNITQNDLASSKIGSLLMLLALLAALKLIAINPALAQVDQSNPKQCDALLRNLLSQRGLPAEVLDHIDIQQLPDLSMQYSIGHIDIFQQLLENLEAGQFLYVSYAHPFRDGLNFRGVVTNDDSTRALWEDQDPDIIAEPSIIIEALQRISQNTSTYLNIGVYKPSNELTAQNLQGFRVESTLNVSIKGDGDVLVISDPDNEVIVSLTFPGYGVASSFSTEEGEYYADEPEICVAEEPAALPES